MVNIISDYIPPFSPLPNIAPFTYKDGETYLSTLDNLRTYVNTTLVDFINTNFTELSDSFTTEVNTLIDQVEGRLSEQNTTVTDQVQVLTDYVNTQVTAIINSSVVVADPLMVTILEDVTSAFRIALNDIITVSLASINDTLTTLDNDFTTLNDSFTTLTTNVNNSLSTQDGKITDVKTKLPINIMDAPYNAVGDGVTDNYDDITAAFLDAKTTGRPCYIPEGNFATSPLIISGADDFNLKMVGRLKRIDNSPRAALLTIKDCNNFTADVFRSDGNVANNFFEGFAVDEAKHDLRIDNCQGVFIEIIDSKNPSGDTLYIAGGPTNASSNIQIGTVSSISDDYTGRNAVSIIKGKNIQIDKVLSIKTGHPGQTSPARIAMPSGFDIEPNFADDIVDNVQVGSINVTSIGGGGFGVFSTQGKIISNITVGSVVIKKEDGAIPNTSSMVIRGAEHLKIGYIKVDSNTVSACGSISESNDVDIYLDFMDSGLNGLVLGYEAALTNFKLSGSVINSLKKGVVIFSADYGVIDLKIKDVGVAEGALVKDSGATTSSNIVFKGDWTKGTGVAAITGGGAANITNWLLDGVNFTGWGVDSRIKGGVALQAISKRNCPNLNFGTAAPNFDAWKVGDIVWNTVPTASGVLGWVCITAGAPGVWKSFGTIAA